MDYDLDAFDVELFEEARSIMKQRFPEMIKVYIEDAGIYIDKINEGFSGGNKEQVSQYAHPLKSASAGLGVMSVSLIAKDIEIGVKDVISGRGDMDSLRGLLLPLEKSFERAQVKIRASL